MFSEFVSRKLRNARYKLLDDKTYFGEISGLEGVWSNAKNLEDCRKELQGVLEGWLLLKIRNRERIPGFSIETNNRQLVKNA